MIGELGSAYKREIEGKPLNHVIFYGGLAVVIFLIMFLFGIRPTAIALAQNNKYRSELVEIKNRMDTKLEQISVAEKDLETVAAGVDNLNLAIPDDTDFQGFLQELVAVSSDAGFVVERVKQTETEADEVPVDLELTGQTSGVPSLLDGIEGMKRFVGIESISLEAKGAESALKLRITIYKI